MVSEDSLCIWKWSSWRSITHQVNSSLIVPRTGQSGNRGFRTTGWPQNSAKTAGKFKWACWFIRQWVRLKRFSVHLTSLMRMRRKTMMLFSRSLANISSLVATSYMSGHAFTNAASSPGKQQSCTYGLCTSWLNTVSLGTKGTSTSEIAYLWA